MPEPGDVVTIDGPGRSYRITYPGPGRVGSKLVHGEPYERRLLADIHRLGLSGTAFDVGAHIGNHTLWLAAVCGFRVHAWEPHDGSRAQLEANIALNPDVDVVVHDWGAGAGDGRGRFTSGMWIEFDPGREGAALHLDRGGVQVHAIDDMLDVADLAVVKIDVEGMEADVITGARRHLTRCRPVVYAETHTPVAHRSIRRALPRGYRMTARIVMGSTMERWEHPDRKQGT